MVRDGTEAQKERYLPRLASGELIGCLALTEPDAGSDATALKTRAVASGDGHYVLNGHKHYITLAPMADLFTVLARTDDPAINDWLNARLDRSEYMPFAPVTLAREAGALYESLDAAAHCAPFMTIALPVTSAVGREHAAVVHVDGTARPQVLDAASNPGMHAILDAFFRRTGVPSLVNTSFNRHGEPIVCTPAEAVDTFLGAGLDALILGPLLVRRLQPVPRPQ